MVLLMSCFAVACGQGEQGAPEKSQVIRLGFAAPLTGPQAHYGEEMQEGVILAVEEINAAHLHLAGRDVHFELLSEDDQADPKTATAVAQKLVDAGIAGMIGHFNSGTSIPASAIYARAGIPEIAMATAAAYTAQGFPTTFRAMTSDTQQGRVAGRFAVERLGAHRVAIIDDRTAYGQGLADEFQKVVRAAGGEVVKREFTNDKATDFTAILTNIKSLEPDLIYFGGADAQAGPMARQLRQLGIRGRFMGGEMLKSPTFIRLAGAASEGTIASLAGLPIEQMPGGSDYMQRYEARFGHPVELYSPYAYDATRVMVAAMEAADSAAPATYLPHLASIRFRGVSASAIAYDGKGDLKSVAITLYQVQGNEWRVLQTVH
jgi:branched-chain amino acid transport system substrate-binding protein